MDKNWLIRKEDCQILGPVTKEKVLELIDNGSLKEEDEISAGNGYWFWIKEKELLEQYLHGTEAQPFNPVNSFEGRRGHYEEGTLPEIKDLEYPENGGWASSDNSFSRMAQYGEVSSSTSEIVVDDKAEAIAEETSSEIVLEEEAAANKEKTLPGINFKEEEMAIEEIDNDEEDEEEPTDVGVLIENAPKPQKNNTTEFELPSDKDLDYPSEINAKPKRKKNKSPSTPKEAKTSQSGEWMSFLKTFFFTIAIVVIGVVVCEKVFKYPILELIFSTVRAQEVNSQINSDSGAGKYLSTQRGWSGFVMSTREPAIPQDCEEAKSYLVGVFMLLDKRDGKIERWQTFIQRCSSRMPKDIQAMLNMPSNKKAEQLRNHLKMWKLSSKERKEALEIYRLVERQRNDAKIVGNFLVQDGLKKKTFLLIGISWI